MSVGGLTNSEREVLTSVAFNVACLRWPVPRLSCLLPEYDHYLTEEDRRYTNWSARLETWCNERRKAGMGTCCQKLGQFCRSEEKISWNLRLFFLCAHDLSLAECGPHGQGYVVKDLLQWVKRARPLAKVGLVLGSIVLKTCTGLSIPTDQFESAFGNTVGWGVSDIFAEAGSVVGEELTTAAYHLNDDEKMERLRGLLDTKKVGKARRYCKRITRLVDLRYVELVCGTYSITSCERGSAGGVSGTPSSSSRHYLERYIAYTAFA
ncbi:unnamed protein product [Sphacelaria rigidula]